MPMPFDFYRQIHKAVPRKWKLERERYVVSTQNKEKK